VSELAHSNPIGRFAGRADLYRRYRPSYPGPAIDFVLAHCRLVTGASVADIGCGTGISSRLLASRGLTVTGIEPNDEMRQLAEAEPILPGATVPDYRSGRAEDTGLPSSALDAVVAAQSFHWFEPQAALREFQRILKPGGWVILIWNEHDERDAFTAAFSALMQATEEAAAIQRSRKGGGEPLLKSPLFRKGECTAFANEQVHNEEELLGRAFSASYAPREEPASTEFAAALRRQFSRFQSGGRVTLHYETLVYTAQRPDRQTAS
jgi:SAM-dependent methyltransferase